MNSRSIRLTAALLFAVRRFGTAAALALLAASLPATTYTVTTTADSGAGSLRQAILDANAGLDTIAFNIPGAGVHTIAPASSLPQITGPIDLDATTQPGYAGSPLVEINATNAGGTGAAFYIKGGDSLIRGLCINRMLGAAIELVTLGNNVITSNYLGTDPTGTAGLPNATGVYTIASTGNVIGGVLPGEGNLISGNGTAIQFNTADNQVLGNRIGTDASGTSAIPNGNGVLISSTSGNIVGGTTGVTPGGPCTGACNLISGNASGISIAQSTNAVVQGNYIGVDVTGSLELPNSIGVALFAGGGSLVGGTVSEARNLISGNFIGISFNSSSGHTIQGNFIGTDVTGTAAIPNAYAGIDAANLSSNNLIGGTTGVAAGGPCTGACNLVSGNTGYGIAVGPGGSGSGGTGNIVQGNRIGTQIDGVSPLGNGSDGVAIAANESQTSVGATAPEAGNVIAYNGGAGVNVLDAFENAIRSNLIFSNGGLGIDLSPAGATANDALDPDGGSNLGQNFPILTTVTILSPTGGGTRIQGVLHSAASTTYDLDFFSNPACIAFPHEFLEGQTFLGASQATTDGAGTATIDVTLAAAIAPGEHVTATATDPAGNTSEFSQRIVFSMAPASAPAAGGAAVTVSGTDFAAGASVTIGGLSAGNVVVNGSTSISATTPALAAGSLSDVTVTNPDATTGTLENGFVADFLDLPPAQQFHAFVTTLVSNAITVGIGGGLYGVNDNTLRQQMAVFLLKGKHGLCYTPPACTGTFPDVACPSTFADWIEALAAEGITGGCGGGNFCPQNPVRRDQMAPFLLKAEHGSGYVPPACTGIFSDVPCPSLFADWIERLAAESITGGCGGSNYCPQNPATRGQMAVFVVKTFNLQ